MVKHAATGNVKRLTCNVKLMKLMLNSAIERDREKNFGVFGKLECFVRKYMRQNKK